MIEGKQERGKENFDADSFCKTTDQFVNYSRLGYETSSEFKLRHWECLPQACRSSLGKRQEGCSKKRHIMAAQQPGPWQSWCCSWQLPWQWYTVALTVVFNSDLFCCGSKNRNCPGPMCPITLCHYSDSKSQHAVGAFSTAASRSGLYWRLSCLGVRSLSYWGSSVHLGSQGPGPRSLRMPLLEGLALPFFAMTDTLRIYAARQGETWRDALALHRAYFRRRLTFYELHRQFQTLACTIQTSPHTPSHTSKICLNHARSRSWQENFPLQAHPFAESEKVERSGAIIANTHTKHTTPASRCCQSCPCTGVHACFSSYRWARFSGPCTLVVQDFLQLNNLVVVGFLHKTSDPPKPPG